MKFLLVGIILLITVSMAAACTEGVTPTPVPPETAITSPDNNLETAIRETLNKPSSEITAGALAELTKLSVFRRGITELTGIEHCSSLTRLNFGDNQISYVSPLAPLANVTYLDLAANQISDIGPLMGNSGISQGDSVDFRVNELDLTEGSEDMVNIKTLEGRSVKVRY